ncbi:hypothetical protein F503_06327 [Ophiostoma piceae UAMH 11346]|uniref:Uncharacterized protein n=1 Tax=Ophiostoma piceae (strain UAMH 11346) TaxID=1262450 RepID=S3CEQ9_OPHP1|nr:hypothetical protein F503_06327 [Ophiostoma piceae UAMH 11346]
MRPSSPPPDAVPSVAVKGAANTSANDLGARCLSNASSMSHGSATTDASSLLSLGTAGRDSRDSLGSETSSSGFSRPSSGSYSGMSALSPSSSSNRLSTGSMVSTGSTITGNNGTGNPPEQRHTKRRGYMRPHGTDFAASARSRESVLSLGSIAHLQHYFARTGLLDLKGQLERKRRGGKARTLDFSQLEGTSSYTGPRVQSMIILSSDTDSSYASMGNSPDLSASGGMFVESPVQERMGDDWYPEDFEGADPAVMLPPTVSTYMHREKPLPKPPSLVELKAELKRSLDSASASLAEAREAKASPNAPATPTSSAPSSPAKMALPNPNPQNAGAKAAVTAWYEIQGMHILDVITLAIRAAKVYYTSHENPDRLDAIKPEREVRSELLGVMDVLKRMATRNFSGGVRTEEIRNMEAWVKSLNAMLSAEEVMIVAEQAEQSSWVWLKDDNWPADASPESGDPARAYAREFAFLQTILASASMTEDKVDTVLPEWVPMDRSAVAASADEASAVTTTTAPTSSTTTPAAPTAFLQHMQNGVCLIQLHNCAVRKSRRRFGAIPTFHADTQKPYRAADNLRYWVKAAELRWEAHLKIDPLGVVCNSRPEVWPAFEDAIYKWCRKVREEITAEVV